MSIRLCWKRGRGRGLLDGSVGVRVFGGSVSIRLCWERGGGCGS